MRRQALVCLALALSLGAVPAFAGTVYVPVLDGNGVDGHEYVTRIWLTNGANRPQVVETLFLPTNTDGTANREDGARKVERTTVRGGKTGIMEVSGRAGLLEITANEDGYEDLAVNAELINADFAGLEVTHSVLPVFTSANLWEAGSTLTLQGLRRTEQGGVYTNLVLGNFGHEQTQCTVEVYKAGGDQIAGTVLLTIKPLTMVHFADALDILGESTIRDVHARIRCDQTFAALLAVFERATGEVLLIEPSATADSGLAPPGDDQPSVPGAALYTRNGTFHVPTAQNPSGIFNIPVPKNETFSKLVVDVDVFNAGWSHEPRKMHSVFWLNRGACCWPKWDGNVFGYVNAWGPGLNRVAIETNVDLGKFQRREFKRNINLEVGRTYHFHYEYDAAGGQIRLTVSTGGQDLVHMVDAATTSAVRTDGSGHYMIYFGHKDATGHGPERPTYGWKYQNLRVEFIP